MPRSLSCFLGLPLVVTQDLRVPFLKRPPIQLTPITCPSIQIMGTARRGGTGL